MVEGHTCGWWLPKRRCIAAVEKDSITSGDVDITLKVNLWGLPNGDLSVSSRRDGGVDWQRRQ
jgi:hypothetical protein